MNQSPPNSFCNIHIILPGSRIQKSSSEASKLAKKKRVENIRNCDVFVDDYCLYIYADVELLKFETEQEINVKEIKSLPLKYNAIERTLDVQVPCLPKPTSESDYKSINKASVQDVHLWKLKRITDRCHLVINNEIVQLEANFGYGFGSNYRGKICHNDSEISLICRVPTPQFVSPLQRSIEREVDELKNFSYEQYKYDFVELQVPEGHENPMDFTYDYNENKWSRDEELLLHNLTIKAVHDDFINIDTSEIDCCLLNILMSICYDIRTTANEATCESSWTRSTLSAVLTYFEPFHSMKSAVISFLRRSIIYPLFRNFELGRLCVEDTIKALQSPNGRDWLLRQLIVTHELFATSDCSREVFNRYYIEDYIRYIYCSNVEHLQMLGQNLKNILFDVTKNSVNLNLVEIEAALIKEIATDNCANIEENESEQDEEDGDDDEDYDDNDDDDEDDDDDDDENTTDHSSSSDTEENSVIEQCIEALKINQ